MTTDSSSTDASPAGDGVGSASADPTPGLSGNHLTADSPPGDLLSLRGVAKHFGPVVALDDINLDVPAGKVTALLGDNGAGKSTLIKIIAGIHGADGGTVYWDGQPVHVHSPHDATALGIATVYQDLALCDNLDIVANMFLGEELGRFGILNESPMERKAKETLAGLSVTSVRSIRQPVGSLSGGQRQSVAVARAVMADARLVIMDEPTAALGVTQTEVVIDLIRRLASSGVAVLVISHNLNDVYAVADRIAIVYLGRLVAQGTLAELDRQSALEFMRLGDAALSEGAPSATAAG
ncbi:MAG TPA: ATP-binding cassette domain-containing protein [Solirubrobacteraceae bacterium]|jgi:ABC-type sugar transport system ATPase subunit